MSEEVIDALLVKLGVTVDQSSFEESTQAVNGLDNAINKAARDRGKTGLDRIGKNMADTGTGARSVEQGIDKLGKAVDRVPRSVNVLQTRLGSATQQMASFRKETQAAVALLSRGAGSAGLGPLSGSLFAMLSGGGPMALATAGVGMLAGNAYNYAGNAIGASIGSKAVDVSSEYLYGLNQYGKSRTGKDGVGEQMLNSAMNIRESVAGGRGVPGTDLIQIYHGNPTPFYDRTKSTKQILEEQVRQISLAKNQVDRVGLARAFGFDNNALDVASAGVDSMRGGVDKYRRGATTDADSDNARKFMESLTALSTDFDKLQNKLGGDVLPALDSFVKRVDGFFSEGGGASQYLDAFKKLADGNLKGFADSFGKAEQSTQVVTPEQNKAMTNWIMSNVPFDKLAHYTYDGAVNGWHKGGLKGALKGGYQGFKDSPVIANPWLDGMTAEGWESAKQAVYSKMPSAHVDDDVSKPLRPEFQARLQQTPAADQPSPLAQGNQNDAQQRALKFFMDNGYTREQSSGMVANLVAESGLKTDAVGDNGQAYGLAQWHPDRQQEFKEVQGRDIRGSSERDQLEFILYELQNKEKAAGEALLKTKNPSQSASVMREMYERAADNPADARRRMQIAENLSSGQATDAVPTPQQQVQAVEAKVPKLANSSVSWEMLPPEPAAQHVEGSEGARVQKLLDQQKPTGGQPTESFKPLESASTLPDSGSNLDKEFIDAALKKTQPVANRFSALTDALPSGTPDTYNMVANPPAPPTVDASQAQPASSDGNVVHIDARGSTDVHKITSEAMRAASDHFQGQMTVAMSHLSTDLDQ